MIKLSKSSSSWSSYLLLRALLLATTLAQVFIFISTFCQQESIPIVSVTAFQIGTTIETARNILVRQRGAVGNLLSQELSRCYNHCFDSRSHHVQQQKQKHATSCFRPWSYTTTKLRMSSSQNTAASSSHMVLSLRHKLRKFDGSSSGRASDHSTVERATHELVLASQSPRRREILDMMGLSQRYRAVPSPLDEIKLQNELRSSNVNPIAYTQRLAEAKAEALARAELDIYKDDNLGLEKCHYKLYLGSDTIVEIDDTILEKPQNQMESNRMLTKMSGRQHHVHTGVALYIVDCTTDNTSSDSDGSAVTLIASFVDTATVQFANLSSEDIEAYIATGEPMDKAGSYGIQGIGGQFVTNITGDFFTVMGLPMHRTSQTLASALSTT